MSSKFQEEYQKLSEKFLEATLREQFLILFCGVVVVVMLSYHLLISPVLTQSDKLNNNISNIQSQISSLTADVAKLSVKINEDPNQPAHARIADLQDEIAQLDAQLAQQTKHLVPASKMASMLENVLTDSKGLKLIELKSIPPTAILAAGPEDQNTQETGLYRHGVTLIFEGSYFDIQQYLAKLEALHWQFYWKKFDYLVGEYPKSKVELDIYTLSTNKAFIGI
ncbi:type II secretion system protein GspM [Paraglaciecola aestuariivivens]